MNKTLKIFLIIFAIVFFIAENFYLFYVIGQQTINSQYYRNQMLDLCQMVNSESKIINDQSELLSEVLDVPRTAEDLKELNCVELLID